MTTPSTWIPADPSLDALMPYAGSRPIALLTGAARRVGRATALALAEGGCDILITYRTSDDEARELLDLLGQRGVHAEARALDLGDLDAVGPFAKSLEADLPRLDVLVHNASIYNRTPLDGVTGKDLLSHYVVNAAAPLLLTRALLPLLRKSPLESKPAVIAMCDIHAMGRPRSKDFTPYSMSKAALAEMVRDLARELAPEIRVNGVAPGVVAFPESGHESDESAQQAYLKRVPLDRAGTPEDAATAIRFLALEAAYTTGQILRVDGGRFIA